VVRLGELTVVANKYKSMQTMVKLDCYDYSHKLGPRNKRKNVIVKKSKDCVVNMHELI